MGILDLFKRHKEDDLSDLGLDEPKSYDFRSSGQDHSPQMPGPASGFNDQYNGQGFGAPQNPQTGSRDQMVAKELEIISSKLDSIRAMLESLNQRVGSLERVAYGDQNYGQQRRF